MLKSKKLLSMPVVAIEDGQLVGYVRSLVIEPKGPRVAALIVDQKGLFREQKIIPYTKVHSIGHDAITIDRAVNAERATNLPHILQLTQESTPLLGARILMESGKALGIIDEYLIAPTTGQITHLEITGNFVEGLFKGRASLEASVIKTISKEMVILSNDAESLLKKLDGGLSDTMRHVAEATGKMWETTVSKSREISETLSRTLDKVKHKEEQPLEEQAQALEELHQPQEEEEEKKDPPDHTGVA